MTKTSKTLIGLIIAALVIAGIWYGVSKKSTAPTEEGPIKIGFISPLTGPVAYTGEPVKNGFELAHEKNSVFNDRIIEIIYEDDKCITEEAVKAAKKQIEIDNVKIVVSGVCSGSALGVAPIAQERKVILISPVAASPALTDSGEYVFRIASPSNLMASNAAKIVKNLGYNTVGVLYELNDYPVGWKAVFNNEFKSLGGEVIIEENFNTGDTDLKTQLMKIKDKNPEIVLVSALSAPSAIQILKQAKELNINKQLIGNEVFSFKSVINSNPDASEGILMTTYKYDLNSTKMKNFLSDYQNKYGKEITEEIYGALGYDLYNLLYEAINECNGAVPNCIKDYLNNMGEKTGASGNYTIDEDGDAVREVVLRKVENGKLIIAE